MLPADCLRAEARGDLAETLRAAGVPEVVEPGTSPPLRDAQATDAVLLEEEGGPRSDLAEVAGRLRLGGVLAVALGDGRRPSGTRAARSARRLLGARRARAHARRWERGMTASGLRPATIGVGERWRAHGLGAGGPFRSGAIVSAARGARRPSVLEAAASEAEGAVGGMRRMRTTVRGSGAIIVEVRAQDGGEYLLRLTAGPSARLQEVAAGNRRQLVAEAPPAVRERLVVPVAEGDARLASYTLEPKLQGTAAPRLGPSLWDACLQFLVALRSTPPGRAPAGRARCRRRCAASARRRR